MEHSKKLALITGASDGIGFELAKIFAKNDYDLIIAADSNKISDKARILRQYEVEVKEILVDLSTHDGMEDLYAQVSGLGRPLDVAVLNAGIGVGGEFLSTDFEQEHKLMHLNMVYLVGLTKKLLKDMVGRNEGKILFTSSIAAEMPGPYYAVYAASKSFVQSFVEAIRYEMKDTGHENITITALQPGPTDTNFFARADMLDTPAGENKKDDPAQVAQQGFDALMSGKDHVVAGSFVNKIQAGLGKLMTEGMGASAHAKSTKPNSLNH
jgi:uncharacterized protein